MIQILGKDSSEFKWFFTPNENDLSTCGQDHSSFIVLINIETGKICWQGDPHKGTPTTQVNLITFQ